METTKEMGVRNGPHLSTPPVLLTFVLSHFQFFPMGHVAYQYRNTDFWRNTLNITHTAKSCKGDREHSSDFHYDILLE